MMDRRKSYWFLPLCLCFLLFIGGCGSAGEEKVQKVSDSETVLEEEKSKDSPLRIGLILSSRDDAENEELEEVFQSLASELGAELSVKTPDVTAAEAAKARKLSYHSFVLCDVNPIEYQMLAVNELVAENADYIVIHGNHGEALEGILASARSRDSGDCLGTGDDGGQLRCLCGYGREGCGRDQNRECVMSILNVEHLTHGFGDRAIFSDVSFRLLKGSISVWWAPTAKENLPS